MKDLVISEVIEQKIFLIRGQKVMLDRDLAVLYGVPVRVLNQAVKRNKRHFPTDFMFRLTWSETTGLRSQFVTLTEKKVDIYLPYAFTDYGIAMLSSVLNSDRAIQVNIQIIRTLKHSAHRGDYYNNNEHDDIYLVEREVDPMTLIFHPDEVAGFKLMPWRELKEKINAKTSGFVSHGQYPRLFEIIEEKGY